MFCKGIVVSAFFLIINAIKCAVNIFLLAEHFILWTFSVDCANGIVYFWS
jgi:hypothetical protein